MCISYENGIEPSKNAFLKVAIIASHPVQYYAPIFRYLSKMVDLTVYYTQSASQKHQADAGFGVPFSWDIDLLSGYKYIFLNNVSSAPNPSSFKGADTPDIGPILRKGQYDSIIVMGWYLKSFIQAIIAAKLIGVPVIIRGDNQLGMSAGKFKRLVRVLGLPIFLRLFDAVCYVGIKNYNYYRNYKYPVSRLFHSPHCVDVKRFRAAAKTEVRTKMRNELGIKNESIVLFSGKLVDFKRPLDAVEAVAHLCKRGMQVSLMIAGSGKCEDLVLNRAQELNVSIYNLGFQNQTKMPAVYAAADILLLPSNSRETWGLVVNEAIACGTPVVLSESVGSSPDLGADGYVGRLYKTGDPFAAAIAIEATINNIPTEKEIRYVSDKFSIEKACEGIISAVKYTYYSR